MAPSSPSSTVRTFVRDFGSNVTLHCPEAESTAAAERVHVEWTCQGCGGVHLRDQYDDGSHVGVGGTPLAVASFDEATGAHSSSSPRLHLDGTTLIVERARSSDSGEYSCTLYDEEGRELSDARKKVLVKLVIQGRSQRRRHLQNVTCLSLQ